jgi:hypothetical protein
MMTDKAPADSRLRRSVEDGDIWQGTGGTQEFLAVECHSHEMQEMGYLSMISPEHTGGSHNLVSTSPNHC